MKVTTLILLAILIIGCQCITAEDVKIRKKIDYSSSFSPDSKVSALFASCGQTINFKTVVLSFFYYNTLPLKTVYIVDYCQTSTEMLATVLPENGRQHSDLFQIISFKGGIIDVLQMILPRVETPYLYSNIQKKFVTTSGFGWLDQAVDILQFSKSMKVRPSQVTFLFPEYKVYDYVGTMHKTPLGTKFNFLHTFRPKTRYYFTFKPSVFDVNFIYNQILGKNIKDFAQKKSCKYDDHVCIVIQMGKQISEERDYHRAIVSFDGGKQCNLEELQS